MSDTNTKAVEREVCPHGDPKDYCEVEVIWGEKVFRHKGIGCVQCVVWFTRGLLDEAATIDNTSSVLCCQKGGSVVGDR